MKPLKFGAKVQLFTEKAKENAIFSFGNFLNYQLFFV